MNAFDTLKKMGFAGQGGSLFFKVTIETTTANETFTLPTINGYTYNSLIYWGDDSYSTITAYNDSNRTHSYSNAGTYTIKITGAFPAWSFYNAGDKDKVTAVDFGNGFPFEYLANGFYGCSNLATVAGRISNSISSGIISFQSLFQGCSALTSIPTGLFDNNPLVTTFAGCFAGCVSLTSIPTGLFDNNPLVTTFYRCFDNCQSLTAIPSGLFDNNINVTSFVNCFWLCLGLSGLSGELWLNPSGASNYTLTSPDYDSGIPDGNGCFENCSGLSDYASIPTYWK